MADFIAAAAVFLAVAGAVYGYMRKKKQGGGCCGCPSGGSCSGCSGCDAAAVFKACGKEEEKQPTDR